MESCFCGFFPDGPRVNLRGRRGLAWRGRGSESGVEAPSSTERERERERRLEAATRSYTGNVRPDRRGSLGLMAPPDACTTRL